MGSHETFRAWFLSLLLVCGLWTPFLQAGSHCCCTGPDVSLVGAADDSMDQCCDPHPNRSSDQPADSDCPVQHCPKACCATTTAPVAVETLTGTFFSGRPTGHFVTMPVTTCPQDSLDGLLRPPQA